MGATVALPVRLFGRCAVKGCSTRRVLDGSSAGVLQRGDSLYVEGTSRVVQNCDHKQLREAGLGCGEHLNFMVWERLNGHFSAVKECDARCTGAKGHNCECACGGENHGADRC